MKTSFKLFPNILFIAGSLVLLGYCHWLGCSPEIEFQLDLNMFLGFAFHLPGWCYFLKASLALILPLGLLGWTNMAKNPLLGMGMILSGIPLIITAAIGFSRQPWGEPFKWPPRLGNKRTFLISLFLLLLISLFTSGYSELLTAPHAQGL